MSNIKELEFNEIALVSGGESHDVRDACNAAARSGRSSSSSWSHMAQNAPDSIYGGDPSCANGIAGGALAGATSGNMLGFAGGVIGGALAGGCFKGSSDRSGNGGNAGRNNCNSGGAAGTCNR